MFSHEVHDCFFVGFTSSAKAIVIRPALGVVQQRTECDLKKGGARQFNAALGHLLFADPFAASAHARLSAKESLKFSGDLFLRTPPGIVFGNNKVAPF